MKKTIYLVFIIIAVILFSCRGNDKKKNFLYVKESPLIDKYEFISYDYCSSNLLFDDHIFGNTMIQSTPNGNFLKCTVINNTEFLFSCGSGKKEVFISKFECGSSNGLYFDGLIMPKLDYDDSDIMILTQKGGSDSWINYFILFSEDKIYSEQALFIDNDNRKYVYLDCKDYRNKNVFFIIHDIMSDVRDTLICNYYKFREDGYPSVNVSHVHLKHDTLFYSIDTGNNMVRDTIFMELNDK